MTGSDRGSFVFTIDIGGVPTVMLDGQVLNEARELCREQWFMDDLAEMKSKGAPLWDRKAKLRARYARSGEANVFNAEAIKADKRSDELMFVYLVDLDEPAASSLSKKSER
jgi:hypothetical protein